MQNHANTLQNLFPQQKNIYGDASFKINLTPEALLKHMKNVPKRYQNMIAIYIGFFRIDPVLYIQLQVSILEVGY